MNPTAPILTSSNDYHWSRTPFPGVEFVWLRRNPDGGGSALIKLEKGASLPPHHHPGWEQVYVTAGKLKIGEHVLDHGDHLFIDRQVVHSVTALQPSTYLAMSETGGVEIIEPTEA